MFAICVFVPVLAAPVPQAGPLMPMPMPMPAFLDAVAAQQKAVTAFLNTDEAWTRAKADDLALALRVAGVVRAREAVPILLKHVAHRDQRREVRAMLQKSDEVEYPAYAALKQYGAEAVPAVLEHVQRTPAPRDESDAARETYLFAALLADRLGDRLNPAGPAVGRARVQAEVDRLRGRASPRLRALLEHYLLK